VNNPELIESNAAQMAASRLAAIVESSDDAIISKDLNDVITSWNKGAEKIFGYTASEMVGTSIMQLIPLESQEAEKNIWGRIRRAEKVELFETLRRTKDGRLINISVTTSPIKDAAGNLIGASKIARDITAQKQHERELARLTKLYATLSQVNQAFVRMPTRDELFRRICHVLNEHGGFRMAWIGWHDPATRQIVPVAVGGEEQDYIRRLRIYADDRPEGRCPTGLAFRSGQPYISNDLLNNPVAGPWKTELVRRGFHAAAVFPIRLNREVCATLTIYSEEPCFFQDQEIALLTQAAGDLSFALDKFAEKEAREQAEKIAESERLFSATMIESMPGILYFYDEHGRFLRWNKNFELVSGYSGEEIARMHPLDFFSKEEKASLQQRIAEVFANGDSFIEASFVSKDGRATPYFFTGRRVMFNRQPCLVGMGVDISERKGAEQALRASEGKFRVIFEQAPMGIAVMNSTTGRFLKINPQYCKIVGYSEAEMLAMKLDQITHPSDLPIVFANMKRLREGVMDAFQIEKRYLCKDRSVVWVSLTFVPLWNAPVGEPQHLAMVEDITARKQAETRLAENEQKYRELVELANSIILRWDTEGKITFLNEFGQRFFGFAAEEILGRSVTGTIVPATESSGRDLQDLMERICAAPESFEQNINENARRNGERVWISWANRVVRDKQGQVREILSIGTDITERKRAEQALRVLNQTLELEVAARTSDLQAALLRAEAADRIKSAFLATMSHELRTPLNSIIGFTGIVLQGLAGPLTAEQSKQLGMVRNSSRHLLELINDVLDLSKIEAGQVELRSEPFLLREALERVVGLVKPLAEKKNLRLSILAPPDLRAVTSDRRRVEQILLNLVNNAIKFTEHGGVTVSAEHVATYQAAPAAPPRPAVRLRVTDTGIGIKTEDLAMLFQPFHQIDSGLARQHEGTGLGLAICRRLATLLGGEIAATSEYAKGSEFTVIIPGQPANAP
jgi:PAS domain S-box-containing protein